MLEMRAICLSVCLLCSGLTSVPAWAVCPSTPTAQRFSFSATGSEVTDRRTSLVWARCSVGQTWSGSACTGVPSAHTHQQALQVAQAASGWRLPNVKELSSIADKGCQGPAIDITAFPGTPQSFYWSSSAYVGASGGAWGVVFDDGVADFSARSDSGAIRLVRVGP